MIIFEVIDTMVKSVFQTKIARIIASAVRHQEFSGAVLVSQAGERLIFQGYGYANLTWRIRNTPQTHFRIASVGKMFTAAMVLHLIEQGKLSLETRLSDILDLQDTKIPSDATVYHMLTMTSGIADWSNEESDHFDEEWAEFCRVHPIYLFRKDADYLPVFANLDPYGPVGEKHRYNGAGYILLGLMIEKLTGMTYFDAVRQNIFIPAGMKDTEFLNLDDVTPGVAEGYIPVRDDRDVITSWKKNIYATTAGPAADGGATSTLEDCLRFSRSLREGKLISPEFTRAMLSPQVVQSDDNYRGFQWRYGFGCFVLLNHEGQVVRWGHTGEEDGVSCRLLYYPQQDMDVIILGNQNECAGRLAWAIQDLFLLS